jgi:hypothetical protein
MMNARVVRAKTLVETLAGKWKDMQAVIKQEEQSRAKLDRVLGVVALRTQWIEIMDAIHSCLLDGMWIASVKPVMSEAGDITQIDITGRVFKDKLVKLKQQDQSNPLETFRDRLKKQARFDEGTTIVEMPPMGADAYAQDFKIQIMLKTQIKAN